ncbi:unnamed protein product [Somion occarium]|uniref:Uncharacterized protein n=1 Tax=Somion occarium TaxID=3059160 RepID=A0ABP1DKN1_9APHY
MANPVVVQDGFPQYCHPIDPSAFWVLLDMMLECSISGIGSSEWVSQILAGSCLIDVQTKTDGRMCLSCSWLRRGIVDLYSWDAYSQISLECRSLLLKSIVSPHCSHRSTTAGNYWPLSVRGYFLRQTLIDGLAGHGREEMYYMFRECDIVYETLGRGAGEDRRRQDIRGLYQRREHDDL